MIGHMKSEIKIDEKLKIMERVEKDLNKQRDEAVLCLSAFIILSSIWVILVALWQKLGEPISKEDMTVGVEIIAVIMLAFTLRFTSMKLMDFGISKKNLLSSIIKASIISIICIGVMIIYKFIICKQPTFISSELQFKYIFTSILQEFLARGFLLTCMVKIYNYKHGKIIALICSSLMFSLLHLFYGFDFMLLAGGLSVILGLLYLKDGNIWGVSIVHFCLGTFAFVFGIV